MLFKWNNDLVVRVENGHGFLKLIFFFWVGGCQSSSSLPKILIWGMQISILWVIHIAKSSKFALTVGNCEVVIALVILVFYHFFSANYYRNQDKYFAMTRFHLIQIMNNTKSFAFLTNIWVSCVKYFHCTWCGVEPPTKFSKTGGAGGAWQDLNF